MGSNRVRVQYVHQSGDVRIDSFRCDALYAILRMGDLPLDMEIVKVVSFPEGHSWYAPTMERAEMVKALESLLKPYFEREMHG